MKKAVLTILFGLGYIIGLAGCAGKDSTAAPPPLPGTETKIEFQSPDPEEFIRDYFHAVVNERNYEHLWTLATESFNDANYGSEYQIFVDFWNSVESLDIESVELSERSDSSVICDVKLTLRIGGDDISAETNYHLVYNDSMDSWMFESP